jgi:UDP-2,4-diacetamido-2,4,6-trideoxy-beta-L-altropyranose hydrolase
MQLFMRTEASANQGLGHLMRCFALAEAARSRGLAVDFLLNDWPEDFERRAQVLGMGLIRLASDLGSQFDLASIAAHVPRGAWLIVDSYAATPDYLLSLKDHYRLCVLDDLADLALYPCDVVVNASNFAFDMAYDQLAPQAIRCLGPDFALIRREFTQKPEPLIKAPAISLIYGGTDIKAYSLKTAQLLLGHFPEHSVKLIISEAHKDKAALEALALSEPRLILCISPPNLAQILAGSELVITAAGGTVGEVAALGLMALVIVVADNQKLALIDFLYPVLDGRQGLPEDLLLWAATFLGDLEACVTLAAKAHEVVDGRGAERLLDILTRA